MSIEFSALQLILSQESTDDATSITREDVVSFLHINQHVVDPPNHARRSDETDTLPQIFSYGRPLGCESIDRQEGLA